MIEKLEEEQLGRPVEQGKKINEIIDEINWLKNRQDLEDQGIKEQLGLVKGWQPIKGVKT
jgi:hypothetical protein